MKKALQNFNRYSPGQKRWKDRQTERLENIQRKRLLRAKEVDDGTDYNVDLTVLRSVSRKP